MSRKSSWNLSGREMWICPRDCPNRCAEPNCHNAETCETWAKHVERQKAIYAAKDAKQKTYTLDTFAYRRRFRLNYD